MPVGRPRTKHVDVDEAIKRLKAGTSVRVLCAEYNISVTNFMKKLKKEGYDLNQDLNRKINTMVRNRRVRESFFDFTLLADLNNPNKRKRSLDQFHTRLSEHAKKVLEKAVENGFSAREYLSLERQNLIDVFEIMMAVLAEVDQKIFFEEEEDRIAAHRASVQDSFDQMKILRQRQSDRLKEQKIQEGKRSEAREAMKKEISDLVNAGKTLNEIQDTVKASRGTVRYHALKMKPDLQVKRKK